MLDGFEAGFNPDQVLVGLQASQKTLPAKLFYDDEGCRLFGEITRLPEYYPTRTELALLHQVAPALAVIPDGSLIEYGASDEGKAALLFDALQPAAYVPIDVAASALRAMAARLAISHPTLDVLPVQADFLAQFDLPSRLPPGSRFGFFPGSTIGNLDRPAAAGFLRQAMATLGRDASFLVGVDLRKSLDVLIPAYDDARGVTAAFNRNILVHLNRVAGATFEPDRFRHIARWNEADSRIEMHLQSVGAQAVQVAGITVQFHDGETIHTESSHKYSVEGFTSLARTAGWASRAVWVDPAQLFSLHLLGAA